MRRPRGVAYRRADGWHVRIDMRETAMPVEWLTTVNNTGGIADSRLSRESRNVVGPWREVLWRRCTSR